MCPSAHLIVPTLPLRRRVLRESNVNPITVKVSLWQKPVGKNMKLLPMMNSPSSEGIPSLDNQPSSSARCLRDQPLRTERDFIGCMLRQAGKCGNLALGYPDRRTGDADAADHVAIANKDRDGNAACAGVWPSLIVQSLCAILARASGSSFRTNHDDSHTTQCNTIAGWSPRNVLGPKICKFSPSLISGRRESDQPNHRGVQNAFRHRIFRQSS